MNAIYSLKNLSFAYPGQAAVIADLSADMSPDQVVAVVGPNGSGKSTLLGLLDFLLAPRAGEIHFMGRCLSAGEYLVARQRIGFLPQNPYLFTSTSACDNVSLGLRFKGMGKSERRSHAMEWLERLGMASLADMPAGQLSGGQKQLLALARILAVRPPVLLLDEPFTYLDKTASSLCMDVLRNMPDYGIRLIVLTTHNQESACGLENQVLSMTVNNRIE